ncbi:VQ protein [Dillenia turbinata]|uniref:VQ protein n=1 Tax=Dillenia turbinata TaxID=194707 RepID=A0AAN8UQ63_9MAGN
MSVNMNSNKVSCVLSSSNATIASASNTMTDPNEPKPRQKRSRASRKTPTTTINANTNNFRALVQRYTGHTSRSLSLRKGPINLNFGSHEDHYHWTKVSSIGDLGYNNYYGQQGQHLPPPCLQQNQPPQCHQDFVKEANMVSLDSFDTSGIFLPSFSNMEPQFSNNFVIMEDPSF